MRLFKWNLLVWCLCISGVASAHVWGPKPEVLGMASFTCVGQDFRIKIINLNSASERNISYQYYTDCDFVSKNLVVPKFFVSNTMKFSFCSQKRLQIVSIPLEPSNSQFSAISNGIDYPSNDACTIAANTINAQLLD